MAKKAAKPVRAKTRLRPPVRSGDVPVTAKLLSETKAELKSEITSARLESAAATNAMRTEIASVRTELKVELKGLKGDMDRQFDEIKVQMSEVTTTIHRTNALFEEQESRNRVVLEAYDQIYRRQEAFEKRLTKLEPSS